MRRLIEGRAAAVRGNSCSLEVSIRYLCTQGISPDAVRRRDIGDEIIGSTEPLKVVPQAMDHIEFISIIELRKEHTYTGFSQGGEENR